MKRSPFDHPDNFLNRELSWLSFNERVLREAENTEIPLFERIKFLSITASNLDEFFMVRTAGLRDQVGVGYTKKDISGMTPRQQLDAIDERAHAFTKRQYRVYNRELLPKLSQNGLEILACSRLEADDRDYLADYFKSAVYPVLTPMAIDSSRPFPLIYNGTLNIAALIKPRGKKKKKKKFDVATVPVPSVLPRLIRLPGKKGVRAKRYILLEDLIEENLGSLFLNHEIICSAPYRIMRNADLSIAEEEAADLLKEIEKQLKERERGEVILFEYNRKMDRRLVKFLKKQFDVRRREMFAKKGPLDLSFLMTCYDMKGFEHLKDPVFIPATCPDLVAHEDIFAQIRRKDVMLHHPYESFEPVIAFIKQASEDPDVLAIKQTLYRVSGNSPIIRYLEEAAHKGKQVMVLVELKARFDEEKNINWARRLEKAGVHVIYGLVGLKTHCKIALVVRREKKGIRRYVHLGTGNYNDTTARLYTDTGMFTCDEKIGEDATEVFNMLSGYSQPAAWNRLIIAPYRMKEQLIDFIKREERHARMGSPSRIIMKCNAICDKDIILALYQASQAGVDIDLIIRGICCLVAGKPGLSDHIRVRSIVGTFLEHARIYYFYNNGAEEVYMGSADLMPRNMERRIEILFPALSPDIKKKAIRILKVQLEDTKKAMIMGPDGTYEPVRCPDKDLAVEAQQVLMQREDGASRTSSSGSGEDLNRQIGGGPR